MKAPEITTIRLGTVASTFDAARDWALANPGERAAVVATAQTAGRGRLGRSWASPEGGCWMTLVWPIGDAAAAGLGGLLAADAAAGLIDAVMLDAGNRSDSVRIRWPNDLLIGGSKVGGLLGETVIVHGGIALLLGIGINVNNASGCLHAGEPLRTPAVSITERIEGPVDLEGFNGDLIGAVGGSLARIGDMAGGVLGDDDLARLDGRLADRGERVRLSGAGPTISGVLHGLDRSGRIVIEHGNGRSAFASGELSCRPLDDRGLAGN